MKKIKEIVLVTFLFFTYSVTSQTSSAPAGNNTALKEAAIKANQKNQERNKQGITGTNQVQKNKVETIQNRFQLDENDQYQGRRDEFLSQLIIKEIPNDFPKYQKWMGVKHYNEIIEDYYKNHLEIVKEKVKNKLLRK
jgi:hypothetical protein